MYRTEVESFVSMILRMISKKKLISERVKMERKNPYNATSHTIRIKFYEFLMHQVLPKNWINTNTESSDKN